jgi:hypothetical protein
MESTGPTAFPWRNWTGQDITPDALGLPLKDSNDRLLPGTLLIEAMGTSGLPPWGVGDGSVEPSVTYVLQQGTRRGASMRTSAPAKLSKNPDWGGETCCFDIQEGCLPNCTLEVTLNPSTPNPKP